MRYLRYIQYFFYHKWLVLYLGRKYFKLPWGRLLSHDLDKLGSFVPLAQRLYWLEKGNKKTPFDFYHHLHVIRSPHHWEYYALGYREPHSIPVTYLMEMAVDWVAAAKAKHEHLPSWLKRNRRRLKIHRLSFEVLREALREMGAL